MDLLKIVIFMSPELKITKTGIASGRKNVVNKVF